MKLTYSNKKTIEKYRKLIGGAKVWQKTEINGFKKLVANARRDWIDNKAYQAEVLELWSDFLKADCEYRITEDQTKVGLQWLKSFLFKKDGKPRKTQAVLNNFYQHHFDIVNNFSHFAFVGYHVEYMPYGEQVCGPVYRVYDKSGDHFDYCVPGQWCDPIVNQYICLNG